MNAIVAGAALAATLLAIALAAIAGRAHDAGAFAFVVLLGLAVARALSCAERGDTRRATVTLLAGLPFVDGALLARSGHLGLALCAATLAPLIKVVAR